MEDSRRRFDSPPSRISHTVLILILVEDSRRLHQAHKRKRKRNVLILILVEDSRRLKPFVNLIKHWESLNPYSSGR